MKNVTKIAMLSFGDIDNYGDIFFALIFEEEMHKRIKDAVVDFFAPCGGYFSGVLYNKFDLSAMKNYDAVILAGGEVVHRKNLKTWDPIYTKRNMALQEKNYSDIVWTMHKATSPFKAFFSVGVLPFENEGDRSDLVATINELSYFSVRGVLSKKIIENELSFNEKIHITPDLGWLFADYIKKNKIRTQNLPAKYFIFQINSIKEEEMEIIASQIDQFLIENNDIKCIFLPIIKPWDDIKYLHGIYHYIKNSSKVIVHNYANVLETGNIILNSEFVVGSSLHSAITAMSDAIPAALINKWPGTKLQDLYFMQFKDRYLTSDIRKIYEICTTFYNNEPIEKSIDLKYSEFMKLRLHKDFDDLCERILISKNKYE